MLNFQIISEHLRTGREIEFSYKNRQYSITNRNQKWYLCCDSTQTQLMELCSFSSFDELLDKVGRFSPEDLTIAEIFDNHLYDPDSVTIF